MARHTCRVLRTLTDDLHDEWFQLEMLRNNTGLLYLYKAEFYYLCEVKKILLSQSLCEPCRSVFDSGGLEKRLWNLWQPVYCIGCKKNHPAFLFPQGQSGGNLCVGLLGHFAPCKHVKISGQLQRHIPNGDSIRCTDPEHLPANDDSKELESSKWFSPHIWLEPRNGESTLDYIRAFPALRINQLQFPGMPALKASLLKWLEERGDDGLCHHASSQFESIVTSLTSDKCECFPISGIPVERILYQRGKRRWCGNHGYYCRHCGARYFWICENDYLVLFVKIERITCAPDSLIWLSNLAFDMDEHPIFNNSTKGVLWCEDPSCGTGSRKRFAMMAFMLKRMTYPDAYFEPRRSNRAFALPFSFDYRIYRLAAKWLGRDNMSRYDGEIALYG
ncbi:hypothetical protein ACHAPU_006259 [Fusarium lateritium]